MTTIKKQQLNKSKLHRKNNNSNQRLNKDHKLSSLLRTSRLKASRVSPDLISLKEEEAATEEEVATEVATEVEEKEEEATEEEVAVEKEEMVKKAHSEAKEEAEPEESQEKVLQLRETKELSLL